MCRIFLVCVMVVSLEATGLEARFWTVYPDGSGDAPTIQAAIDSAAAGDGIMVKGGNYYEENITLDGKDIDMIDLFEGIPYIYAPTHGSGTGFIIRNVSSVLKLNSLQFIGFDTGVSIESASPTINCISINDCSSGVIVSGTASAPFIGYSVVDSCGTAVEVQGGSGVTFENLTIFFCGSGGVFTAGDATFSRSIIYGCDTGFECSGGTVTFYCNNHFNNVTNYSGCTEGLTDFFDDTILCLWASLGSSPYMLHDESPCWTGANPCGQKVGAFIFEFGCVGESVEYRSWGAIKSIYN